MYFQCCNSTHAPILLPEGEAVIIGRSVATKISDKLCSRNQLQLVANYNKKYVMVKQLGTNASQIEGIDIGHKKTDKLLPEQKLYVVGMKYPHRIKVCLPKESSSASVEKSKIYNDQNSNGEAKKRKLDDHSDLEDKCDNGESNKMKTSEPAKRKTSSHWSQGLRGSMEDPDLQVFKDDKIVVIKDKYPKAKYHWLVMPIEKIVSTVHLGSNHLPLLNHMLEIGKKIVKDNTEKNGKHKFRYGYHAVHSMAHLHMHVISQDFDSPALKTKRHWNSFTTEYFVDAEDILKEIENDGKVKNRKHMGDLLKESLRCHKCKKELKNIPELKKHIVRCR